MSGTSGTVSRTGGVSAKTRDDALIAGFLADEPPAVKTISTWIERAAYRFRRRLGGEWEDALQDLHLEVMGVLRGGQFHGKAQLRTFIHQVVANKCLNRIRSAGRWQWIDLADLEIPLAMASFDARDSLRRTTVKDLLWRVLEKTPDDCRKLWQLLLEGRNYDEMSNTTGIAAGTLRVQVLRCRKKAIKIRHQLADR